MLKKFFPICVPLLTFLLLRGRVDSQFQLSCSEYNFTSNRYYFPNFGGRETVLNQTWESSSRGVTYIYPDIVSGVNCSGVIKAVEFCYRIDSSVYYNSNQLVFYFSMLKENHTKFTVLENVDVFSSPSAAKCRNIQTRLHCCDILTLESGFKLSSSIKNISISISIPVSHSSNITLQGYHSSFAEQFRVYLLSEKPTSSHFEVNQNAVTSRPLLFVWFHVEEDRFLTSDPSSVPYVLTSSAEATIQFPTESVVENTDSVPGYFATSASATIQTSTKSADQSTDSFLKTHIGIAAIAGAVGGLVLLVFSICIIFIIVHVNFKKKKKRQMQAYNFSEDMYKNDIYVGDSTLKEDYKGLHNPSYFYTSAGIQSEINPVDKSTANNDEVRYDYIKTNTRTESSAYNHLNQKNEDVYIVPPNDLSQLYAHLEGYRTEALTRDKIKFGETLGSGQFGKVFQGLWKTADGTKEVAVKTLKEGCKQLDRIKFLQEAAVMSQFKHANVAAMYGVITDGDPILLVLEILEKGDLRKYLISMRSETGNEISPNLKATDLLRYCCQISCGMRYLSSKSFVHRDLAARNILVSGDRVCKIADFGMSRDLLDETYYISKGGTIPVKWTAPEVQQKNDASTIIESTTKEWNSVETINDTYTALHYKKYSTASDVWSYGVVLYEIWSVGHKPFEGVSNNKVLKILESGYRLPPPPGCPRAIYSIMISCWNLQADKRPAFGHIYQQLSSPDFELQISGTDECNDHSDAFKLGADLKCANNLYNDLQVKYLKTSTKLTSNGNNCSSNDYM